MCITFCHRLVASAPEEPEVRFQGQQRQHRAGTEVPELQQSSVEQLGGSGVNLLAASSTGQDTPVSQCHQGVLWAHWAPPLSSHSSWG